MNNEQPTLNDDELRSLLRDAEAGLESPRLAHGDLAGRVRRRDRQRRRRTRMFSTVAPMVAIGVVVVAWWLGPGAVSVKVDQHVANAAFDLNDIEWLRAEAELHERVARELVSQRKRDAAREQVRLALLRTDPLDDVREQVDVVAYRMVMRADDLQTRMDPEAIDVYRDVVQLFPNTSSAELARQRLTQLGLSDGES